MPRLRLRTGHFLNHEITDLVDPWQPRDSVVLHHGLGKSIVYWRAWVRLLAPSFRVVAVDSLGNGASSRPRGYPWSIANYAADAEELIASLDAERVHFVGEGLGGCVGLHLAATRPDLVATLTVASTPFRPAEGTGNLPDASREIARSGLAAWLDRSLQDRMAWDRLPPEMFAWYRAERLRTSPRIMAEQMAAQAGVDLEWALPKIQAPTLLLAPGRSHVNAHQQMLAMGETIARSRVVSFPDEGQWVTFERPDACVSAFRQFLVDTEPARSSGPAR
jgi:pimeloyl-ACP methyl ester carboxylesterase